MSVVQPPVVKIFRIFCFGPDSSNTLGYKFAPYVNSVENGIFQFSDFSTSPFRDRAAPAPNLICILKEISISRWGKMRIFGRRCDTATHKLKVIKICKPVDDDQPLRPYDAKLSI